MTSFIFRTLIRGQARTKAVGCLHSLIKTWDLSFGWRFFLMSTDSAQLIFHFNTSLLFTTFSSEPPEAYIDDEHDEKDTTSCQLGIGGAGIQILGITPVLL